MVNQIELKIMKIPFFLKFTTVLYNSKKYENFSTLKTTQLTIYQHFMTDFKCLKRTQSSFKQS